ncbi:MAG: hypothetical protein EA365_08405 [Gloeocapsa sp. DLM2.Bin57]|nr:MAG: hypothetical protein EA365_08405 [Gloeocapsa sp. DLM2.Bin57]
MLVISLLFGLPVRADSSFDTFETEITQEVENKDDGDDIQENQIEDTDDIDTDDIDTDDNDEVSN